jgi:hypothetical protein
MLSSFPAKKTKTSDKSHHYHTLKKSWALPFYKNLKCTDIIV